MYTESLSFSPSRSMLQRAGSFSTARNSSSSFANSPKKAGTKDNNSTSTINTVNNTGGGQNIQQLTMDAGKIHVCTFFIV